jgi:hypothetical protein
MERLLLVDDDVELCETEYFSAEGFGVESVHDGVRGLGSAHATSSTAAIWSPLAWNGWSATSIATPK